MFFNPPRPNPEGVASPCIGWCELGEDGICLGCYRSLPEIGAWSSLTDPQRLQVLKQCSERRHQDHGETA